MLFARIVAVAIAALAVGAPDTSDAQTLRKSGPPAEFPPASYKGTQYVDSRGCAYIRAGIDGNVTWVPRVARNRRAVCNMTPTTVAGTTKAVPQKASTAPEIITLDEPAVQPAATTVQQTVKPKTAPKVATAPAVVKAKPKPAVKRVAKPVAKPVATLAPAPKTAAAPKPVATPAPKAVRTTACSGASALSQQYINPNSKRNPVRCGSQTETPFNRAVRGDEITPASNVATRRVQAPAPAIAPQPAPAKRRVALAPKPAPASKTPAILQLFKAPKSVRGDAVPETSYPRSTRVVPRHVAQARAQVGAFVVPKGYRPAWDDDRLNPKRAEGTLGGRDRMNLIWTSTVPRRLIDRSTGKDVTAKVALVYPYLDTNRQSAELGDVSIVSRNGQVMKRIVRNPKAAKPVYSTRSAPKAAAPTTAKPVKATSSQPSAATGRYVQVGLFGVPANAAATAQKLNALGLPVKVAALTRKGKSYQSVLAGPFSGNAASKALSAVKRAGFSDAYLR